MFAQLSAVAFLALISLSYSQITSSGQCEDRTSLSPVNYFNLSAYASEGRLWYTIFTYATLANCQTVSYNLLNSTTTDFHWQRKNLTSGAWVGRDDGIVSFEPVSENNEGIIVLRYQNISSPFIYSVIGVVYDEYTLDYRCINVNESARTELIWVRSRERNFTEEQAAAVQQIIVDNGIEDLEPRYAEQDPELCSRD